MRLLFNFFVSVVFLGWSLCVLSCGILVFPVIGEVSKNWKDGLKIFFLGLFYLFVHVEQILFFKFIFPMLQKILFSIRILIGPVLILGFPFSLFV
ncbi:MAG: hypothetical protein ACPLZ9_03350 [Candidatus Ratteibacteria bacterium]